MGNAHIIRRWFEEVWNEGREATIDELLAPTAHGYGLAGNEMMPVSGPEGFKPFWRQLRGACPDIRFTIHDTVSERDRVVARWTAEMTHHGDHLGVAATRRQVTVTGMTLVRVAGGQIQEGWNNWDELTMAKELGSIPSVRAEV